MAKLKGKKVDESCAGFPAYCPKCGAECEKWDDYCRQIDEHYKSYQQYYQLVNETRENMGLKPLPITETKIGHR